MCLRLNFQRRHENMKSKLFKLFRMVALSAFLAALGWASYSAAHYLHTDSRFEVRQLSVSGLRRVKENQVIDRASLDISVNAFTVDLEQIRRSVEELKWVRHALVQRI